MTISKVNKSNRLKLLLLQTRIENEVCAACPFSNHTSRKHCEDCTSYKELQEIGNWLLNDTAIRKGRVIEVIHPVKREELTIMTPYMLSVNEYMSLRRNGLSDPKIALKLKVTIGSFKKWKSDAGLTKTKEMRVRN